MKQHNIPDDLLLKDILADCTNKLNAIAYLNDCKMQSALTPSERLDQHIKAVEAFLLERHQWSDAPKLPAGFENWEEIDDYFSAPTKPATNKTTNKPPGPTNKPTLGTKAQISAEELEGRISRQAARASRGEISKAELQLYLKDLALESDLHFAAIHTLYRAKQEESICDRFDKLIEANCFGSALQLELMQLASESGRSKRDIADFYQLRLAELERTSSDLNQEIDDQMALSSKTLDISEFLPEKLADPIKRLAFLMEVRPEICLTALLCGISSLHKSATRVTLLGDRNYKQPGNLYGATVGEPGTNKSSVYKTFIEDPLLRMQIEVLREYRKVVEDHKERIRLYESCPAKDKQHEFPEGKPIEVKDLPRPQIYFFSSGTEPGLSAQFDEHPNRIMMYIRDELRGIISSANKKDKSDSGIDRASLLEYYGGKTNSDLRLDGMVRYAGRCLLAMYGTIQPTPLRREMCMADEEDGLWSRFIFVNQPYEINDCNDEGLTYNLDELIAWLYRHIDKLPEAQYRLDSKATAFFKKQRRILKEKVSSEPEMALKAVYAKTDARIGRLALNLHVVRSLFEGTGNVAETIPLQRVVEAAKLAAFYVHQVRLVYQEAKPVGELALSIPLAAILKKSYELAKTPVAGWVKARDLSTGVNCFKGLAADKIREMFLELQKMEQGTTRGKGIRLEFCASPPKATNNTNKQP